MDRAFHEKLRNAGGGVLAPPKKPVRRGSDEDASETAVLLDEALRITEEGSYEDNPFDELPALPFGR